MAIGNSKLTYDEHQKAHALLLAARWGLWRKIGEFHSTHAKNAPWTGRGRTLHEQLGFLRHQLDMLFWKQKFDGSPEVTDEELARLYNPGRDLEPADYVAWLYDGLYTEFLRLIEGKVPKALFAKAQDVGAKLHEIRYPFQNMEHYRRVGR